MLPNMIASSQSCLLTHDFKPNQTKPNHDMTIEKTIQGAWRISDIIGGYLEVRQYFGYSKSEAIRAFIAEHGKGAS
jgi:hypothetical protein